MAKFLGEFFRNWSRHNGFTVAKGLDRERYAPCPDWLNTLSEFAPRFLTETDFFFFLSPSS